jgi:hypothetical protein
MSLFNWCHYVLQNITLSQTAKAKICCVSFFLLALTAKNILTHHLLLLYN